MSFSVDIITTGIFPVVYLKDDVSGTAIEVYSFGALLNAFTVNDVNIIDGFASPQDALDNITEGFKSAKLSPYVCRTKDAQFKFNEKQYAIGKFILNKEALHGLLYDAVFTITEHAADATKAVVTLQYHYKSTENFPFDYTCIVCYILEKNNTLTLTTTIKNNADNAMPLCDGWHPYFTLGTAIDELLFEMNAATMLEFDERLLPTGNIVPYHHFQTAEAFASASLDNCFVLNDTSHTACVLQNKKSGLQFAVQPDKSYPYLQVYTPPHRKSVAIENLSAAPDAFNNGIGLKVLQPQEEAAFTTTYIVTRTS